MDERDLVGLLEIPDAGFYLLVYAGEAAQILPMLCPVEGGGNRAAACLPNRDGDGQAVVFTGLLGNRYIYAVQSIRYAAAEQLSGLSAAEGEFAFTARRESCVVMAICRRTRED